MTEIRFFPVGNGDMTLIELESGTTILVDINIRATADDPDDETPNVARMLRDRLQRDVSGRRFVDVFLLSHPDEDHCKGLERHFHLGPPDEWVEKDDKVLIREIWSSPMVFRRASKNHTLCVDAKAFNREAKRRVRRFEEVGHQVGNGDRILILGEDENGKTDSLSDILIRVGETITHINGQYEASMSGLLLAPLPKDDDSANEDKRAKNKSSTIIRFSLSGNGYADKCRFLTGGDAEVEIWEEQWAQHGKEPDKLSYDLMQAPHHCSWRSLSHDSWSDKREGAKVSEDARLALSQVREGALIVASSKPIQDDDNDPPCIRAKREYVEIVDDVGGSFECVGDRSEPLVIEVGANGPKLKAKLLTTAAVIGSGAVGGQPLAHG